MAPEHRRAHIRARAHDLADRQILTVIEIEPREPSAVARDNPHRYQGGGFRDPGSPLAAWLGQRGRW